MRIREFWKSLPEGAGREILFLAVAGAALAVSFFGLVDLPFDAAWVAIVLCGIPILKDAAVGVFTRFDIKADVLVSMALIASVLTDEIFAAGEVAFIMQIGSFLEEFTVAKARAGIEKLVRLTPRTARRILENQNEETIPAEAVKVGDLLRVLPGETIPVDGVIVHGNTSVDQSVMTGESIPVDKGEGDEVFSGTLNCFGAFEMRSSKRDSDSSIQRMIRLVQSADAGKARIVGIADRWATWIVVAAVLSAALAWIVTGELVRAVTILVVFCPCALVLATPTAIMAAIGNATRHGVLIREGDALERLATVRDIVFDKTGTLTHGRPEVTALHNFHAVLPDRELALIAAAVEARSEHPLGKAVVRGFPGGERTTFPEVEAFEMVPGRGVSARVAGRPFLAGSLELLRSRGVELPEEGASKAEEQLAEGATLILLALDGRFCGIIALADLVRENAAATVAELNAIGVRTVLLTGDNPSAARHIAELLGIRDFRAGCLPENKLAWIDETMRKGEPVCMVGDGVNDAPALKCARVGIAMGGIGSDIAIEAADIALVKDDIGQLPFLFRLARRMMTTIRINLTFSMILNFAAVVLAWLGLLNPVIGALVHNAGSVLVIVNSALLLNWRGRRNSTP
ncbi:cation-translocating P-type ATPase [uncultured Victivallis sp.]|uniref:heavy metal translocating P-type ATPase n=1 Tax=uncultured Victivallis sp. TaxID=354118 RepID=UPI0025D83BA0|nr:cation-translocating P-type ATPase [uncultured Victivallis sp.]